jgi:hypothetical protein
MKIDIHCHVLGNGKDINHVDNDIYYNTPENAVGKFDAKKYFVKYVVTKLIENFIKKEGGKIDNHEITAPNYLDMMFQLLSESKEIDAIVLLAMDAVYGGKGTHGLMAAQTELYISNGFLFRKVSELNERLQNSDDATIRNKRFLFGASVNPNRTNWEKELKFVLEETDAVLLKWVPSAMHIEVWNHDHKDFYKMLAASGMPLLCHVGPEYAFLEGVSQASLDNYKYLEVPLGYGVKVIAAHCAAPLFPTDSNDLDGFLSFIKGCNSGGDVKLWADTSALTTATRVFLLGKIVQNIRPDWMIHGSDFPVPISGAEHLPLITYDMTAEEYYDIINTKNPFDIDVKIKRAHRFSDLILSNGENVLRMTK